MAQVRKACHRNGFFYIDLDERTEFLTNAISQARGFFAMDDSDPGKAAIRRDGNDYGWVPMYAEPAYQPGTVAHLEAFDCGIDDVSGTATHNIWPAISDFQNDVTACWRGISDIGAATLTLLSSAAGFDEEFLADACSSQSLNTLRLIHYPENAATGDDRNVGISAHTDFECITLIYQSAPGLELTNVTGHWLDAPSHNGRIVVLLGDMLERFTNGYFRATGHRVRNTRHERMSVVMFFAVNEDVLVKPLPPHVDDHNQARYEAVFQSTHIEAEVEQARQNAA